MIKYTQFNRGAEQTRLREACAANTLIPDADNAAVGKIELVLSYAVFCIGLFAMKEK